jgi:hypothetical protein
MTRRRVRIPPSTLKSPNRLYCLSGLYLYGSFIGVEMPVAELKKKSPAIAGLF